MGWYKLQTNTNQRVMHDIVLIFALALNTSVANIVLFAYDPIEQIQYLYGYGQDGRSIMRSIDRGQTWFVTSPSEFTMVNYFSY